MKRNRKRSSRPLSFEALESRRVLRTLTVDLTTDEFDGNTSPGDFSLREAIFFATRGNGPDVYFAPSLSGKTIQLTDELVIEGSVALHGLGANKLTIAAADNHRHFTVTGEAYRAAPNVEIAGLKLTGGDTSDSGAAIRSRGANLLVRDVWITGNATASHGGAIFAIAGPENAETPGTVTILNSTISGNMAAQTGGGIAVGGGRLALVNSTVSGNAAEDQGGGLHVAGGEAAVINSTVTGNRADRDGGNDPGTDRGGGISRSGGAVALGNSLVIGNFRGVGMTPSDIDGVMAAGSLHNIIGDAGSSGGLRNGVNANRIGNQGAGVLNVGSVIGALKFNGGMTPTHALPASSPAIDFGANRLTVDGNGKVILPKDQRGTGRVIDGNLDGVKVVDCGAVEFGRAPVVNLSGSVIYTEQAAPRILAAAATLTGADSPNFGGGRLTVTLAMATSSDRLAIHHQGTGPGQIGIAANKVSFGGNVIGSFTGGVGAPLRVYLNARATRAATQTLIRNITFANVSDNPATAARKVTFVLTDNAGFNSAVKFKTVTIAPVNDPAVLINRGSNYVVHNLVLRHTTIMPQGDVSDPDVATFAGAQLRVRIIQGAGADNRLGLSTSITRSGNILRYNGVAFGTVNVNGGVGTTDLIVTFNAAATRTLVGMLVRSVNFSIVDPEVAPPTGDNEPIRRVLFTLTNPNGVVSSTPAITVDPKFLRA